MAWSGNTAFALTLVSRFVLGPNHGPGHGLETAILSDPAFCRYAAHRPSGSNDFDKQPGLELSFLALLYFLQTQTWAPVHTTWVRSRFRSEHRVCTANTKYMCLRWGVA